MQVLQYAVSSSRRSCISGLYIYIWMSFFLAQTLFNDQLLVLYVSRVIEVLDAQLCQFLDGDESSWDFDYNCFMKLNWLIIAAVGIEVFIICCLEESISQEWRILGTARSHSIYLINQPMSLNLLSVVLSSEMRKRFQLLLIAMRK